MHFLHQCIKTLRTLLMGCLIMALILAPIPSVPSQVPQQTHEIETEQNPSSQSQSSENETPEICPYNDLPSKDIHDRLALLSEDVNQNLALILNASDIQARETSLNDLDRLIQEYFIIKEDVQTALTQSVELSAEDLDEKGQNCLKADQIKLTASLIQITDNIVFNQTHFRMADFAAEDLSQYTLTIPNSIYFNILIPEMNLAGSSYLNAEQQLQLLDIIQTFSFEFSFPNETDEQTEASIFLTPGNDIPGEEELLQDTMSLPDIFEEELPSIPSILTEEEIDNLIPSEEAEEEPVEMCPYDDLPEISQSLHESLKPLYEEVKQHYDVARFTNNVPGVPLIETSLPHFEAFSRTYQLRKADLQNYLEDPNYSLGRYAEFPEKDNRECLFLDKMGLMAKMIETATNIVMGQISLGQSLPEIDLSQYTLVISKSVFQDMGDPGNLNNQLVLERSVGLFFIEEHPPEGQSEPSIHIALDPMALTNYQMQMEISKDSRSSAIQFILYPILRAYYYSLIQIQLLKDPSHLELPDVNRQFIDNGYLSFELQETISKDIIKQRKESDFRTNLKSALARLMVDEEHTTALLQVLEELDVDIGIPIPEKTDEEKESEKFNTLIESINPVWQEMSLFYNPYEATDALHHIPDNIKDTVNIEALQEQEFSKLFFRHIRDILGYWRTDLFCKEFDEVDFEELYQSLTVITNTVHTSHKTNILKRTECLSQLKSYLTYLFQRAKYLSVTEYIANHFDQLNPEQIDAITKSADSHNDTSFSVLSTFNVLDESAENLGNRLNNSTLLDQWINKALEFTLVSNPSTDGMDNQYIDNLIFQSINISHLEQGSREDEVLDGFPLANPLYQTIQHQKRFQISEETNNVFTRIVQQPYLSARAEFANIVEGYISELLKRYHTYSSLCLVQEYLTPPHPRSLCYERMYHTPAKIFIDPDEVTKVIESINPPQQAMGQDVFNRKVQVLNEILDIGKAMGFFLLPTQPEEGYRPGVYYPNIMRSYVPKLSDIFSQLRQPSDDNWIVSGKTKADWYIEIYQGILFRQALGQQRLYSDHPEEDLPLYRRTMNWIKGWWDDSVGRRPFYKVVAEQCPVLLENTYNIEDFAQCREKIKPLVIEALDNRTEMIRAHINELLSLPEEDQYEKALQILNIPSYAQQLQLNDPELFSFHFNSRRVEKNTPPPTRWESLFTDPNIIKMAEGFMTSTLWVLPLFLARFLPGIFFKNLRVTSQGFVNRYFAVNLPFFTYSMIGQWRDYHYRIAPQDDLIQNLYFATVGHNSLVNTLEWMASDNQRTTLAMSGVMTVAITAALITGIGSFYTVRSLQSRWMRSGTARVQEILKNEANPNAFQWNREGINYLRQRLTETDYQFVEKFYKKAMARLRKLEQQASQYNHPEFKELVGLTPNAKVTHQNIFHAINRKLGNPSLSYSQRVYLERMKKAIELDMQFIQNPVMQNLARGAEIAL